MSDCQKNRDKNRLVREGTTQGERFPAALDPASAPVDERGVEQGIAYARAYAKFLRYYDADNNKAGDWQPFFSKDVSALLAIMAMQDVEEYRTKIKGYIENEEFGKLSSCIGMLARQLDVLKEGLPEEYPLKGILHNLITNRLKKDFNKLILYVRDQRNDKFSSWKNDIPSFKVIRSVSNTAFLDILEQHPFSTDWIVSEVTEQKDTVKDKQAEWTCYLRKLYYQGENTSANSQETELTPNDLKKISEQFLKVYARTVTEARRAFGESLTKWNRHDPHYTLFLAFLRLLEHARNEMNTLTGRHLDFYYRDILRFKEKEIVPPKAHVLVELAKKVPSHLVKAGELFKAGKDDLGKDVFFASERDFVANRAQVAELKTVYRHGKELVTKERHPDKHNGRLYASSVANSADGVGGELISEDKSWHPFFNKIYEDRKLTKIEMPKAEVGFAIASHYLWMAGGTRTINITFESEAVEVNESNGEEICPDQTPSADGKKNVTCYLTGEKEWIKAEVLEDFKVDSKKPELKIRLSGADSAIVPYSSKTHGYNFQTDLPVLRMELTHRDEGYSYDTLRKLKFKKINLTLDVEGLKPLAVSNDFGPIDTSKPFQPFGASPVKGSALIIGLKEALQKKDLKYIEAKIQWQNKKVSSCYNCKVAAKIDYLSSGTWCPYLNLNVKDEGEGQYGEKKDRIKECLDSDQDISCIIPLIEDCTLLESPIYLFGKHCKENKSPYIESYNFSNQNSINTSSKNGYVRIKLNETFGQESYEQALFDYINSLHEKKDITKVSDAVSTAIEALGECSREEDNQALKNIRGNITQIKEDLDKEPPKPPTIPVATEITLNYKATQAIRLDNKDEFETRSARFFHIAPFGQAEQHPFLKLEQEAKPEIFLLPQLALPPKKDDKPAGVEAAVPEAAEFYIGITDLKPPQNLSLLFQVADGTANPQVKKPDPPHIHWSYLRQNEWISFPPDAVEDHTNELLTSGIITFAVPRGASDDNTLMPAGKHWIRAAVSTNPDAVCRLRMVAAQALKVTFADKENDPAFSAKVLPEGTISKLAQPVAAVKKITQPFPSYDGRGKEKPKAFYTRVSERLRHKDRAVTLWDYERLILEAFPEVHKVKCLNHTRYNEEEEQYIHNAPGHVTIVTVADRERHSLPDPLRPNISLGLRKKIEDFLMDRRSIFVTPHVVNPTFEEVKVDFEVKLRPGFDETYSIHLLRQDLIRFLSPWAFPGGGSPSFGGKIYKSALINFVEEQAYVDYVIDFKLMHLLGICQDADQQDHEEVEGKDAISILVSVPASDHIISTIPAS